MRVLAIDIGSSSVKAAVLSGPTPRRISRREYGTTFAAARVEVPTAVLLRAVRQAIAELGEDARRADLIVPTGMSPSWLAMDGNGRALTPIVTHQDRRSQKEAEEIEAAVGRARHMHLTGNRPTPGGISSTTARWFVRHAKPVMKQADLIGHLNTWLIRLATGERVIDPSNASFTGLYRTTNLGGWDGDLIVAAKVKGSWLPRVMDANQIAGRVTAAGARTFGLREGTPMLAGFVDGSGGVLAVGATPGTVLNVVGSTDVLAVVTDRARPIEGLLTRAVGVGRRWVSVGTIAAAGSGLDWLHRTFFADHDQAAFRRELKKTAGRDVPTGLEVDFSLAGSRTAVEPTAAWVKGLTLGTDRSDILAAGLHWLAGQSAARFDLFRRAKVKYAQHAYTTGGGDAALAGVLRKGWPGEWTFESIDEATLAGAWACANSVGQT